MTRTTLLFIIMIMQVLPISVTNTSVGVYVLYVVY